MPVLLPAKRSQFTVAVMEVAPAPLGVVKLVGVVITRLELPTVKV